MTLKEYLSEIDRQFRTGLAREHSYRPALQQLLTSLLPGLTVTNEPARISCGAPDFILTRKGDGLPVAFVEAKDIDDGDLDGRRAHREQFTRYRSSLDHIMFTDYLDFHLYEYGEYADSVRIAEVRGDKITALTGVDDKFKALVSRLADAIPQRITSASKLTAQMASKARLLAEAIKAALSETDGCYANQQLRGQFNAFRRVLLHDLTDEGFADIYAQTIAYGMFAARLHDDTPDTFSRQEAAMLIPKTNPFLRKIFQSIAGYDLDERIAWIVDDLAATFRVTDTAKIMETYGKSGRHDDPMIHFYEDFLSTYDPRLRKAKGVWYTPQPIVTFIVRAVDEILQRDFGLAEGLASDAMIKREVINEQYVKGKKGMKPTIKKQFHKVQLLDPATGTGTFLAEAVRHIHAKFEGMQGIWQSYVGEHLLPRLNGFELLMASYAIAHLKLDYLLQSTGYIHRGDSRLRIYLTNSLEEFHPETGTVFAEWLSTEANEASRIKRDTPVMVIIGNPPYNGESKNKDKWIMELMDDYKKEPGGNIGLKERNPKWLNDDYVKFIRMAQHFVECNGEGIIAFINPHGYLDNPTFRGMRWSLLKAFNLIYTIDLHGNSKKKETCPDGSKDENVFDIQQGVSINIFIKTSKTEQGLGKVFHHDIWGKRQDKYDYLSHAKFSEVPFKEVTPLQAPMYFFKPKDFDNIGTYNKGFAINELFTNYSIGIVTTRDSFLICDTPEEVRERITDLINLPEEFLRNKYNLKESKDWNIKQAKDAVGGEYDGSSVKEIDYREFDKKYLYYTSQSNGIVARPRYNLMRHLFNDNNLSLVTCRQLAINDWSHAFVSSHIVESCYISNKTKEIGYIFPLYKISSVSDKKNPDTNPDTKSLVPNFDSTIYNSIRDGVGEDIEPLELFDYIYAVLHSPTYRTRYREMLRIDFPRIPRPRNAAWLHALAVKGAELRRLHLMDRIDGWQLTTTYPEAGDDMVTDAVWDDGRVRINTSQWFGDVSRTTWDFYIGGYQPAQKWLKDRRGRRLTFDDIRHYRRIIAVLDGTARLMGEIDTLMW